jgi:isoleucyl-tRNA synthetase
MSKSKGNVIAPREIIDRYGAEVLRLWVASSDYQDDVRISEKILKQLTDAYRRMRNTSRFILGNLGDFDPEEDAVAYSDMAEMDRFALHRLQDLVKRTREAYDSFEFHGAYHALYNYCTLDLSAFYLDVLKDRLYTAPPKSRARRSAQTALHHTLDTLARLMAPILVFMADEVWTHMPKRSDMPGNVHLAQLPEAEGSLMDNRLAQRWESILTLRREVSKAIEEARSQKKIGHSLDASVTLSLPEGLLETVKPTIEELRAVFIVSKVSMTWDGGLDGAYQSTKIPGLAIRVDPAPGEKCGRCWIRDPSVGADESHKAICSRCVQALEAGAMGHD